jgi:serine phosphatase RsbU (regulator of sigma subunit)
VPATGASPVAAAQAATPPPAGARNHRVRGSASKPRPNSGADPGPIRVVSRTVTRTVRDIAHVIPSWAKAVIAALAALLLVAALLILAGALRARRLRAQRAALAADVGELQGALLPLVPATVGALAVSVAYRPAAGLAAGGDFYDAFPLSNGRVAVLVGDVSGHGRESLRSATFMRHMVRSYLEAGLGPRAALQLAGEIVDQHDRDEFATILIAVHDPVARTLSYAAAGHPPPITSGPGAHEPLIVGSAPPIGVGSPTGLRQTTLSVAGGTAVCLFTDGLMEARVGVGTLGRKRLDTIVRELGPQATASELIERVEREADLIPDDVAVCMVRVEGEAAAAGSSVRVEELEVDAQDLDRERVWRFLSGCGIADAEIENVIASARARSAAEGTALIRVRLADDRSGVDVLSTSSSQGNAEVARLSPRRASRP